MRTVVYFTTELPVSWEKLMGGINRITREMTDPTIRDVTKKARDDREGLPAELTIGITGELEDEETF